MILELPNYTIIIQFFFFLGTLLILNRFVFSPLLLVIEERQKMTSGAHREAIRLSKEAAEILTTYQDNMRIYRYELRWMREAVKQELARNESERVARLREGFVGVMRETKKNISDQILEAQTVLAKEISMASQDIVDRFIGKRA